MSPLPSRALAASPFTWAGVVVLMIFSVVFYFQNPPQLSLESANAFERFKAGGWMSPLTLDQSPVPELSIPYSGWPPLYMTGLCLLSLTGLSFWAAGLVYNVLLTLLTGLLAVRIARRCGSSWPAGLVFFAAVACPAYALQLKFAYPVMMVPLCCLVPVLAALIVYEGGLSRKRKVMLAVGAGLTASLGTWVSFMAAPALFLVFGLSARRHGGSDAGLAAMRVVRWSVGLGVCMVAGFVLFKLVAGWAFVHSPRISEHASGGMSKLLERMMPGAKGLAAAAFFWVVRFFWVMLPAALLLLLLKRRGEPVCSGIAPGRMVVGVLFLIPLLFVCFLPGEIGQSAHIFHGVDFVPLAAMAPVLLIQYRAGVAMKTTLVWALFGLMFLQGYRVLPALALENPRSGGERPWFNAPGDYEYEIEPVSMSARSLLRTTFKNGFNISAVDGRVASLDSTAAKWQEWVKCGPLWRSALEDRSVAVGWTADREMFSYFTGRPLLSVKSMEEFEDRLAGLGRLKLLTKTAVIVPAGLNVQPLLQRLAAHGCTAETREIPGAIFSLLIVRTTAAP